MPTCRISLKAFEIFKRLSENDLFPAHVDGNPPALRFDYEAQNLFDEWRCAFENRLRSGVFCPPLESHFSKYRKLVPVLALVFHLIDMADGTASGSVSRKALQQSLAWSEYLESHAMRIYSTAQAPEMECARELMKHIKSGDIKDGSSIREIHRNQWYQLDNSEIVKTGFSLLEDYGWVRIGMNSSSLKNLYCSAQFSKTVIWEVKEYSFFRLISFTRSKLILSG